MYGRHVTLQLSSVLFPTRIRTHALCDWSKCSLFVSFKKKVIAPKTLFLWVWLCAFAPTKKPRQKSATKSFLKMPSQWKWSSWSMSKNLGRSPFEDILVDAEDIPFACAITDTCTCVRLISSLCYFRARLIAVKGARNKFCEKALHF